MARVCLKSSKISNFVLKDVDISKIVKKAFPNKNYMWTDTIFAFVLGVITYAYPKFKVNLSKHG